MPIQIESVTQNQDGHCHIVYTGAGDCVAQIQQAFESSEWPVRVEPIGDTTDQATVIYDDDHPIMRIRVCRYLKMAGIGVPKIWIEKHTAPALSVNIAGNLTALEISRQADGQYRQENCKVDLSEPKGFGTVSLWQSHFFGRIRDVSARKSFGSIFAFGRPS